MFNVPGIYRLFIYQIFDLRWSKDGDVVRMTFQASFLVSVYAGLPLTSSSTTE